MKLKSKDRRLKPIDEDEFASNYPTQLRQAREDFDYLENQPKQLRTKTRLPKRLRR
jgi:hypothetical protein